MTAEEGKIEVSYIILERAEGLIEEVGKPEVAHTFAGANAILRKWATTAPKNGGYDKCDFTILFQDGETYKGRFDLEKSHESAPSPLQDHIVSLQGFCAGLNQAWANDEEYAKIITRYKGDGTYQRAKDILDKYLFGDSAQRLNHFAITQGGL